MFLLFSYFESYQPQSVLIFCLFSMKHSYLVILLGYFNTSLLLRSLKLYSTKEHPIASQKMTDGDQVILSKVNFQKK